MVLNNTSNSNRNIRMSSDVPETQTTLMEYLGTLSPATSSNSPFSPIAIMYGTDISPEAVAFNTQLPYLEILEQPAEKFRFRYKSEMVGTHGSLAGNSADRTKKSTFPTVRLHNYSGHAKIRCSLVQSHIDEPHAHRLVMRAGIGERDDPHDVEVTPNSDYTVCFQGMGIMHTAKKNLGEELYKKKMQLIHEQNARHEITTKFSEEFNELHRECEERAKEMNLNTVRLKFEAFQVQTTSYNTVKLIPICEPVFSHGINNLKSALTGELKIVRMDHTTTSCLGDQEIFILVEKVTKNNIKVRFFETNEDEVEIWYAYGRFSHIDVHHQYAIVLKTPPYRDPNIDRPVQVYIQLERPSDGARSDPRPFKYKPADRIGCKRARYSGSLSSNELPATINNPSLGSTSISCSSFIMRNPNFFDDWNNHKSVEFDNLFESLFEQYEELACDGPYKYDRPPTKIIDAKTNNLARRVTSQLSEYIKVKPQQEDLERRVLELFRITEDGNNALHTSILCEQFFHVKYLLVLMSNMTHLPLANTKNNNGETPLHMAVIVKNPTIVRLLLSVGADANAIDCNGNTPLHIAAQEKFSLSLYPELIKTTNLALENDDGISVMEFAISNGDLKSVKSLVTLGTIDINRNRSKDGSTPLHLAIKEGKVEIVRYLIHETDARLDIEDFNKVTPSQTARLLAESGEEHFQEIATIVTHFVSQYGFETLLVKTELDDSDNCDNDFVIKSEPMSPVLQNMFELSESFSVESINMLSPVIDKSDFLQYLVKELDFAAIATSLSDVTTKMLLHYSNITGRTPEDIRQLAVNFGAIDVANLIAECCIVKNI